MEPFNHFAVMAWALAAIAAALWVGLLKQLGFWRWLKYQWLDCKAYLFDAETDDCEVVWEYPITFQTAPPEPPESGDPGSPRPKRKRRPKK